MKTALTNLLLVLLLGGITYFTYYTTYTPEPHKEEEFMDWVIHGFSLDETQRKAIQASHDAYLPKCEFLSQELDEARDALIALAKASPGEASLKKAHENVLKLEKDSYDIAVEHIFEIASLMPEGEGIRYKKTLLNSLIAIEAGEHLPVSRLLEHHTNK